jgi:replicative DNA helicase
MRVEEIIISSLLFDEEFTRKTIPFIKESYFTENVEKEIFNKIEEFIGKYNNLPTKDILLLEISNDKSVNEDLNKKVVKYLNDLNYDKKDGKWLVDTAEKFCQEKAVYNAIMESISILDPKSKNDKNSIPGILTKALSVSFDEYIGHDFIENSDLRFEYYNREEDKIPFDLEYFNLITQGGLSRKTLNVLMAGPGVGKSLTMCHMAASNLLAGKNVLYITLEMAEERIAERIDANLLNIPVTELKGFPKNIYDDKINKLKKKTAGKLIVKEYPTAAAGAGHFRHLINELALKKDFIPDIIYIDYLNLCTSMRYKGNFNGDTFGYVKTVAEEIRGLGVEKNMCIVSATQLNREGFKESDPGMENTSESFALPATVDLMMAMITTEELDSLGQIMFKQLKNRYGPLDLNRRFVIGVDKSKMRLYNVEQQAQSGVMKDTPVMDNSKFGERAHEDELMKFVTKKAGKKDFSKLFS